MEISVVSMPVKNLPLPIKKSPLTLPVAETLPSDIMLPPVTFPEMFAKPVAVILAVSMLSNATLAIIAV